MLVLGPGLWLWVQVAGAGTGRQGGSAGADAGQVGWGPGCLEGPFPPDLRQGEVSSQTVAGSQGQGG